MIGVGCEQQFACFQQPFQIGFRLVMRISQFDLLPKAQDSQQTGSVIRLSGFFFNGDNGFGEKLPADLPGVDQIAVER